MNKNCLDCTSYRNKGCDRFLISVDPEVDCQRCGKFSQSPGITIENIWTLQKQGKLFQVSEDRFLGWEEQAGTLMPAVACLVLRKSFSDSPIIKEHITKGLSVYIWDEVIHGFKKK